MAGKVLMTGNEAAAEAAIVAGCRFYYGYPITPQNEIPAYMSRRMPEVGGTFVQAESELAAINMVYGTSAAGKRVMTSSSSPGISLKQEGISYIAGSELPAVILNVQRGGPGLGDIRTSQADYFQATRGGGHGDYRTIVLAPDSVQEMADLTRDAFDLADKYRTPVIVLADARIGQMMEPVEFKKRPKPELPPKDWALTGAKGRPRNIVKSFYWIEGDLEKFNLHLQKKYRKIEEKEPRWEEIETEDAEIMVAAYGTAARISKEALRLGREKGARIGLFRPITLWPFPRARLAQLAETTRGVLVVELSAGQMVEDVRLSIEGKVPVDFLGRLGGAVPTSTEILEKAENILQETMEKVG
ncbi:MAG: 2-ketoisovalerate ferredoxin oxidoreductase [Planctomycetes bacterium DG_23]|nr:MAG: 2-ketoisovalerate ferredoxin oxidoreductase [Planctomycetes bacterium DG_23]